MRTNPDISLLWQWTLNEKTRFKELFFLHRKFAEPALAKSYALKSHNKNDNNHDNKKV